MAVSFRGVSNAAGQNAGTTTTASTVSITPTLPGSTASGDRVFVVQCASNTSAAAPANWTVVGSKDTIVGSGAVAAGGGQRYMSVYYRDYDGVWTMPAFTLTSAAQNSHWIGAVSLQKGGTDTWDTPTISTAGSDFGTADTAHSDVTGSLTTHTNGFLIVGTVENDLATITSGALTQSGATLGAVTERCDGGTATGNDVSGYIHTCSVTTGATAALTFTGTLSAASQGGSRVIEQTVTAAVPGAISVIGTATSTSTSGTLTITKPAATANGDLLLAFHGNGFGAYATMAPPAGWATTTGLDQGSNAQHFKLYTKTASGEGASWAFTSNADSNCLTVVVLRNADTVAANWLYAIPAWAASSATGTCPSVTGAIAGSILLCCASCETGGDSSTQPAGMVEQSDLWSGGTQTESVATLLNPGTPTGTKSFTLLNWATQAAGGINFSIVVNPVAAAAAVAPGEQINQTVFRSYLY